MGLRYRDLGPVRLDRDDSSVTVPAGRLTTVLSVLLVHANHRVSTDSLLDALWGDTVRGQNAQTLESHIWRLRKLLEPEHRSGEPYSTVLHSAQGYQLLVAGDQVDSLLFAQMAGQARDLMVSDQPARALFRCEQALGLWRGRPWAPHTDAQWAAPPAARLEELRGDVAHQRIDALLELGQISLALADLEMLISESPLRERLWAQRMLGLYRAGRTDQALQAYQRLRELLIDELGVEPGPDLRSLHARILADDPDLGAPPSGARSVAESHSVRDHSSTSPGVADTAVKLPHRRTPLIGRDRQTIELAELINNRRLVSVVGSAGCGKTSIAVEAARHAVGRFPDGVVFIDLSAATERSQLLDAVSSALRLPGSAAEARTQSLVAFTRTRRMLLILDNCEQLLEDVADLADALLGTDTELSILTTTREPLNLDDEQVFALPPLPVLEFADTEAADIPTLVGQPAIELFLMRLKASAPEVDVDAGDTRLAARICAAVDGVPLAIELAAAQARAYTLTEIMHRVQSDLAGLARIGRGANRHHSSLRAAIDLSSAALADEEIAMHHALSVVPGPVTPALAAALVNRSVPAAELTLGRLLHRSMLTAVAPDRPERPTRFAQLATIRSHAQGSLLPRRREECQDRRDAWVHELVGRMPRLGGDAEVDWVEEVNDDLTAVRATLHRRLIDHPDGDGVFLAARLGAFWYDHGMIGEWERWTRLAQSVSDRSEPVDLLLTELSHAEVMAIMGRTDHLADAINAIELRRRDFTPAQQIMLGEGLLTSVNAAFVTGDTAVAISAEAAGRSFAAQAGDRDLLLLAAICRLGIDIVSGQTDFADVQRQAQGLWETAREYENTYASWVIASWGALASILGADPAATMLWSTRVLAKYTRSGIGGVSLVLEIRAAALTLNGLHPQAVQVFSASRAYARRAGLPWPLSPTTEPFFAAAAATLRGQDREDAEHLGSHLSLDDIARASTGEESTSGQHVDLSIERSGNASGTVRDGLDHPHTARPPRR